MCNVSECSSVTRVFMQCVRITTDNIRGTVLGLGYKLALSWRDLRGR